MLELKLIHVGETPLAYIVSTSSYFKFNMSL